MHKLDAAESHRRRFSCAVYFLGARASRCTGWLWRPAKPRRGGERRAPHGVHVSSNFSRTGLRPMKVSEAMTPQVVTAKPETTIAQVARTMSEVDCGSVPVMADGKVVGLVTDRDIVIRVVA